MQILLIQNIFSENFKENEEELKPISNLNAIFETETTNIKSKLI